MDITQFHAAFFEESREGLDAMEAGLLGLEESGRADAETVNTIFRAAHSLALATSLGVQAPNGDPA